MIDRSARDRLSELIRHLAAGLITNDEFEDALPIRSHDPAVEELIDESWYLSSDLSEYRFIGRYRLSRETKRHLARWILFLKTDLEYEWPTWYPLLVLAANLFTLGLAGRLIRARWQRHGDLSVWPFIRSVDLEAALQRAPYLAATPANGHS